MDDTALQKLASPCVEAAERNLAVLKALTQQQLLGRFCLLLLLSER